MRYIGGKFRQSKKLSQHIKCVYDGETYIEPFCGSLSTIKYVKNFIKYGVFSDVQYQLIKMWTSLKKGWIPPQEISEQLYKEIKNKNDINNPLTAYVGYGLSFGGKYFGGYARPGIKNYSRKYDIQLYDSIMLYKNYIKCLDKIDIICADYKTYYNAKNCLFYLDPPYCGCTKQNKSLNFDHNLFWDFCRHISKYNKVIITEFNAPDDFIKIYNFGDTVVRHRNAIKDKKGLINEYIYVYNNGILSDKDFMYIDDGGAIVW